MPLTSPYLIKILFGLSVLSSMQLGASELDKNIWSVADLVVKADTNTHLFGKLQTRMVDHHLSAVFNGLSDSITADANPFTGATAFTIQVLVRPDSSGQTAQRFIHLQDKALRRLMVELRLNGKGQWAMDTFLNSDKGSHPLLDMAYTHSCDEWHWACLVYDGHTMTNYVDGKKELSFDLPFSPMIEGQIAIGSRLNHVYWFKGAISEVQFDRRALAAQELHHSVIEAP